MGKRKMKQVKLEEAQVAAIQNGTPGPAKKRVRFNSQLEYNTDPRPKKQKNGIAKAIIKKPMQLKMEASDGEDELSEFEEMEEMEAAFNQESDNEDEGDEATFSPEELSNNEDDEEDQEPIVKQEQKPDAKPKIKKAAGDQQQPQKERVKKTSKETHQEQKKLKEERKRKKNKFYEVGVQAKKVWEEARRIDLAKEKREPLIEQLLKLVQGHAKEIIRAHDTSRVIETIVQHGTERQRTILFDELKPIIIELCKLRYAKFYVLKMLHYGHRDQKNKIIESFYGQVIKLLTHKEAAAVVDYAYNEVANATQRAHLVQEFFGSNFSLFKDNNVCSLEEALKQIPNEATRKQLLTKFKDNLIKIADKTIFRFPITHYLYRELFHHADDELKSELVDSLSEIVVEMVHTRDGARVACEALWAANAKQRKQILKSMKKYITKIVEEKHGYLVLMAAFDCVDDTKLIEKTIITEIFKGPVVMSLAKTKNGLKLYEYLLAPRDSRFFHKDIVSILAAGDSNPNSKKDRQVRESELLQMASPHFYQLLIDHGTEMMSDNACCLFMSLIIQKAGKEGDLAQLRKQALQAIIRPIQEEGLFYEAQEESNMHPIEKLGPSLLLKKLIYQDKAANGVSMQPGEPSKPKKSKSKNQIDMKESFSMYFVNAISKEVLRSYVNCNKGCFLLLNLLETEIEDIKQKLLITLKGLSKTLSRKEYKGASLLHEYLKKSNVE